MSKTFQKLFEPLRIGPYTLKNRIIKSPITTRMSLSSGEVTPQLLDHYAAFAKGGAAMVTIESTEVESRHPRVRPNLRVDSDALLAGLHELAETIHLNGAHACLQLRHVGMWGVDPISPSGVPCRKSGGRDYVTPRVMSIAEIEEVISLFSSAAYRAKFAGFDMVELHGATSYILEQFVSPHTNKREDGWGKDFEGRIRLPLEVLRQVRKKCGPDFPVGYRIVLSELQPDGTNFDEASVFIKRLEEEGVAYISPMVGTYETFHTGEGTMAMRAPKAQTVRYTEPLKKQVNIPVFASFQIHEPELMEQILEKNQADAILLGRPLLADPELPKKIREGRLQDIRMCIVCNNCSDTSMVTQQKLYCTQNPAAGRERDYAVRPAQSRKKVVVIGGGPAGLEAARVAALRGHAVTLIEKNRELGGQVKIASLPIGKEHLFPYVIGWRANQCQKAGVTIETGKEATPEIVEKHHPDVVIVATGAEPLTPEKAAGLYTIATDAAGRLLEANPRIPEIERGSRINAVMASDVLQGKAKVGKKVVIAGGGLVGVETADFIAEKGLAEAVTIVEMLPQIAAEMSLMNRAYMTQKLAEYGVKVLTNTKIVGIAEGSVAAASQDGEEFTIEADSLVVAVGAIAENKLGPALEGKAPEVYVIGDSKEPRSLKEAILEGAHVARQI
ncbi:MAG: FAD-dependent oxidoreductase [Chloroflexi bacterium]|nr:FAD-dependent oxidoreductase [Chloroflexota bacterium]